ncbi:MAG: FAD/NAD(P)-binding protein [Planctomycetales bacterium]|nr:FAD/NAD(P)-binding protein [Planctomycetales bacterium]
MNAQVAPNPWLAKPAAIRAIRHEIPGVSTYDLELLNPADREQYRFLPGQFNMLYLPGAGEIAISISQDPGELTASPPSSGQRSTQFLAHTVRIAGAVTHTLSTLGVGGTLGLRGPYGVGWPLAECEGRDVVIVAGGIGLAPLRPMICQLLRERERYRNLYLLYGARSPDTILYAAELERWQRRGLNVYTTVDRSSDGWKGNVGVVTVLLERLKFESSRATVVCCGPEVMMRFTAATCLRIGVPTTDIWVSMERNMQCAAGFCGHCQLGPEFVCKDGPVFRLDRIAPWMDVEGL